MSKRGAAAASFQGAFRRWAWENEFGTPKVRETNPKVKGARPDPQTTKIKKGFFCWSPEEKPTIHRSVAGGRTLCGLPIRPMPERADAWPNYGKACSRCRTLAKK